MALGILACLLYGFFFPIFLAPKDKKLGPATKSFN